MVVHSQQTPKSIPKNNVWAIVTSSGKENGLSERVKVERDVDKMNELEREKFSVESGVEEKKIKKKINKNKR